MSGEYVSRDYLLGEYDRQHQGPPGGARKIIAEAPAADVAPVQHGRWIPAQDYSDGNEDIECSSCGEWFKSLELCGRLGEPNYCPVCGSMNKDGG